MAKKEEIKLTGTFYRIVKAERSLVKLETTVMEDGKVISQVSTEPNFIDVVCKELTRILATNHIFMA